jgi:riboflavin synthase
MFTGLVESLGIVKSKTNSQDGAFIEIECELESNDLKIGDSISINGACQTIIELNSSRSLFKVYSSYKTLELTNLGYLQIGENVNLERALLPTTRLGGHIVQGHVDGIGKVLSRQSKDDNSVEIFWVEVPVSLSKYIVERGSIAVDGISLTVVSIESNRLELVLIPETIRKTNAKDWKEGSIVNLETDIMARYMEKFANHS